MIQFKRPLEGRKKIEFEWNVLGATYVGDHKYDVLMMDKKHAVLQELEIMLDEDGTPISMGTSFWIDGAGKEEVEYGTEAELIKALRLVAGPTATTEGNRPMGQDDLEWELIYTNDHGGGVLETIWTNRKFAVFKEEILKPEGIDTSYTVFKTLKSFYTLAELRKELGLV